MRYLFDVNETLLDMSGLDDLFGGGERRREWFDLLIRTALTRTASGAHRPFGPLGVEVAQGLGHDLEAPQLREAMGRLTAHPDVGEGLAVVRGAGHQVVALGNSALDLIEEQLAFAGIRSLFDEVRSAETVGALKPARAVYESALDGTPPSDAVMVAAHDWDLAGAASAGLRTVLIDRGLQPPLPGFPPDRVADRIGDCLL